MDLCNKTENFHYTQYKIIKINDVQIKNRESEK